MILLSKKHFMFLFLLMAAAHTAAGIYGLRLSLNPGSTSSMDLKYHGETMFFFTLISSSVSLLLFLHVFRKSRNIYAELDRMIERNRTGSRTPSEGLNRIGVLGERINTLFEEVNEQSERKGIKISALSGLVEFFMRNIPLSMVVLDVTGRVVEVSSHYLKTKGANREEIVAGPIGRLVPGLDFQEISALLRKTHTTAERDYGPVHLIFTPVFNRENVIANIVCTFGHEDIMKGPVFSTISSPPD